MRSPDDGRRLECRRLHAAGAVPGLAARAAREDDPLDEVGKKERLRRTRRHENTKLEWYKRV
jgi:hypothetical protein